MSLTFYTNPMSRGRIARWMLEEAGAAYDTVVLDYGTTMKGPDYLAINPMGKVPAIKHNETVVTECAAICAYLADAFPDAGLGPSAIAERGAYYRWMFFGAGPVEQATTNRAIGAVPPPEKQGMMGYGTLEHTLNALEGRLKQSPFFAGDRFSAVDVYLGSQIGWGVQFGSIDKRPAFTEYLGRIMGRPAYARAAEKDNALLPAQP